MRKKGMDNMKIPDKSLTFVGHMGYKIEDSESLASMLVQEPLVEYGVKPASLDSDLELLRYARKGIETALLWEFLKVIGTSKQDFEEFLPSSLKTFSRKERLDEAMSERILNIIRVFKKGEEVFRSIDAFKQWLTLYHPILGSKPSDYLKTSTGCHLLLDELGRAQHGIMA